MKSTHRVVYRAANVQQAHLLANLLNERGIFAYVTNDALQGVGGDLPFGMTTAPQVVVHQDEADEARQIAREFDATTSTPAPPAERPFQFELAVLFYCVTWAAVFFGVNRLVDNPQLAGLANYALIGTFLVVSYVLVARRIARRNRAYPGAPSAGNWKEAPSGAGESEVDDGYSDDDSDADGDLPYEWPVCPHCGRPRLTSCPVCETAGSEFASAYLPMEAAIAESAASDGSGYHVICPTCDEAFEAEFPSECEWCGHRFRDGRPVHRAESPVTSPFEDMNPRAWIVLGGLTTSILAVVGLFIWMVSRR